MNQENVSELRPMKAKDPAAGLAKRTESEQIAYLKGIEDRFAKLVKEGKIVLDPDQKPEDPPKYVIARFTEDKEEAVTFSDRMDQCALFDRLLARTFANGIVDGLQTARKQIAGMSGLYKKCVDVLDGMIVHVRGEIPKI